MKNISKKLLFIILSSIFTTTCLAQSGTIKGFIYDHSNGEPIIFTNVILDKTTMGASSDVNGFFIINKVPKGSYLLKVQCLGYQDTTISVKIINSSTVSLRIELTPQVKTLSVVEIQGQKEISRTESQVSIKKITAQDIEKMPSIGGQADIAQYIQVLPGVVFSGDQGGQLYIRGGSAIQNKVLLDGMVIYNPFHSIGLFSVFETDVIRNADIYTGGFNAKYGGRLSSIMDITTKDGNKKTTSGKISASTFGSSAILEGPILKDNDQRDYSLSYLITEKNSYLSQTSKSLYSYVDNKLPYDFFDLYGKLTLASSSGSKINLFGFNFTDNVDGYKDIANFDWKNRGIGANFIIIPNNSPALVEGVFAYSDYTMTMKQTSDNTTQKSNIGSFNGNLAVTRFFRKNQLKYGLELIGNTTNTEYESDEEIKDYSTDAGAYMIFKGFLGNLLYEPSIRFSYYASLDEFIPEPRLSLKYNITNKFRLKAATGLYSQSFVDTKSDRDIVNLFTGYLTASPDLPGGVVSTYRGKAVNHYVEKATHYIFGFEYDIINHLTMNVEGYYKKMTNLISVNRDKLFDDDVDHTEYADYLKKSFSVEDGEAYGGDISLKYNDGRLYVWAIYSYGKVTKTNETQTYAPHYDRRHNVNVLVSYQMGKNRSFEVSARWNYGSGFPYTPTAGFGENISLSNDIGSDYIATNGSLSTIYGKLNSKRLPAYHRLDLSAKKRFDVFKHSILEIDFSVTNVYDRDNLFYYDRITASRVNQLPIMPSLGMTLKF
jgi:hypothetical protein